MNNLMQDENGKCDTIIETAKLSSKNGWKDIGETKKWMRKCPKCNKEIYHANKWNCIYSDRKKRTCSECRIKLSKKISDSFTRKCPKCHEDLKYTNKYNAYYAEKQQLLCISCCQLGHVAANKNPFVTLERPCPNCGKLIYHKSRYTKSRGLRRNSLCHSCQNIIYRKRYATMGRIVKKLQSISSHFTTMFNPKACEYFDKLNREKGWNLQHAMNGGEIKMIGYSLDAYDKQRNIIVEYDEKYHKSKKYRQYDLKRQQTLIKHLHCDFYRYDETIEALSHVHSSNATKFEPIGNQVAILQNV